MLVCQPRRYCQFVCISFWNSHLQRDRHALKSMNPFWRRSMPKKRFWGEERKRVALEILLSTDLGSICCVISDGASEAIIIHIQSQRRKLQLMRLKKNVHRSYLCCVS